MISLYYGKRLEDRENEIITKLKKKEDDDLCVFCLEGNSMEFYEYDDKRLEHICKCRPIIHKTCFYELYMKNQKCIICNTIIFRKLGLIEKLKININILIFRIYQFMVVIFIISIFCKYILFNLYTYIFFLLV